MPAADAAPLFGGYARTCVVPHHIVTTHVAGKRPFTKVIELTTCCHCPVRDGSRHEECSDACPYLFGVAISAFLLVIVSTHG